MSEGDLHRRLLVFAAFQGALTTLIGFGGLLVFKQGGAIATVHYTLWMLSASMLGSVVPYALGRWISVQVRHLVRLCFALPAVLLWWADGRPTLLALAGGSSFPI